jgi:hypothetical protein
MGSLSLQLSVCVCGCVVAAAAVRLCPAGRASVRACIFFVMRCARSSVESTYELYNSLFFPIRLQAPVIWCILSLGCGSSTSRPTPVRQFAVAFALCWRRPSRASGLDRMEFGLLCGCTWLSKEDGRAITRLMCARQAGRRVIAGASGAPQCS